MAASRPEVDDVSPVMAYLGRTAASEPLVLLSGEVDDDRYGIIDHTIADAARDGTTVHLDLTGVRFMGSAGLHVLVRAARLLEDEGKRLRVDRAPPTVRRVLEVTGLAELLGLPPTDGQGD
jgi:anti-sigma B factor antagonist